ncbi:multiple sugar transport system permease protein [Bosea sp. OK403]|jgi:multiple sugar transport system permease protein|uniref:Maltose/maltodextrin transport system permease protein MalG n=1 Tax=Bosea vaviloviae TaxID=1526658 RepID=A0A1D7TYI4_9HYPH|nr:MULTISPECIES: carbohydrate ABC transporter permease [Bosea]AOO80188.1 ABC transporter permease [Bosea vaviloviae]MDR6874066.1 multiple sugar transport system permease protein [Bosea sp. BE125]SFJ36468.1 multiple sugar transport system permease protein [Bosea sp. OK403]
MSKPPSLLRAALKLLGVLVIVAWSVLPIALIAMSSFKSDRDIFSLTSRFSFAPTLANYELLWSRWGDFFFGLWNSFIVTVGATVLAVLVSLLAGFAYSRHASKGLQASAFFLIFIRLIPPIVITLPLFPVVNWLGLNDTHLILIVLYATFFVSLGTIVMRTFIDQIPRELDEAAMIDGASQMQIVWRVILPMAAQGMLAVAVFVIVYAWNEFLFAFIFTTTKAKTAPLVISEMIGAVEGVEWGVLFAASTVQLLPVLAFVILMQKHLVAGLTAGAVKG